MFRKVLIANRGEIAVRIVCACREMGLRSVAVYSDVDRAALHVRWADEAFAIGPAAAAESYLNTAKLLEAARRSGAEAIHPGYGFLSEDAAFARACADAGVKFIGPSPAAMEAMGSKTSARRSMQAAGVPVVPGTMRGLNSGAEADRAAREIGYPVLLKAAAGGGGKGMRAVASPSELAAALEAARSEALRAFGNDEVYLEKLLVNPRHIEVQVLGDEHGNLVHLGERECSLQRRHQKVLEESPSPLVDPALRDRIGEAAVRVARAAGYSSAGTVEFLLDSDRNFYFLEMNTRLQVEHPVTEMVTGLDLVEWQIRIAAGQRLGFTQEQVEMRGHAIECRIYAEDPDNNFFPSPGRITRLRTPSGPGIREDGGVYEGWTVPLDYDPLLTKLIAHAPSRAQAIARLARALDEYQVGGIKTNVSLFQRILRHPDFAAGRLDTGFLDRMLAATDDQPKTATADGLGPQQIAAIAAAVFAAAESAGVAKPPAGASLASAFGSANHAAVAPAPSGWKSAGRREALREK
ncbi:MAG: acetyl-CoA carboxylase biotin carboxylase subunit [Acidobacteria bacterium]|nr:acetyl-CoA carboxylase biotin carboxylase subunit [Acidobacteriota bacterium]